MSTAKQQQPQQHLLPKQTVRNGATNNELDQKKRKYILEMRKSLCDENIIQPDGSLNLKYFNVKKGHYWSEKENRKLIEGVLQYGPCKIKDIKKKVSKDEPKANWTDTEIRLRVCRLLKYYNLKDYEGRMFADEEEILEEAKKNKKEAQSRNALVGGVLYNPQHDNDDFFMSASGSKSKSKKP